MYSSQHSFFEFRNYGIGIKKGNPIDFHLSQNENSSVWLYTETEICVLVGDSFHLMQDEPKSLQKNERKLLFSVEKPLLVILA